MGSEDFIRKMLLTEGVEAPAVCQKEFDHHFEGAVNPEWFDQKSFFEVIFQKEGIEYIAEFGTDGELLRYKMYLEKELLPALIRDKLEEEREIMNAVQINERSHIKYEIIVRTTALQRSLVISDQFGKILEEKSL